MKRKVESLGLTQEQLEINQSSTYISQQSSDKEVIKGIFEQNEQEIQKRERLIAQMEEQLKEYNSKKFPSRQIAKEILAQYPHMTSLTLARGDYIESAALNAGTASEPAEKVLAIIKARESVSEEEISKLEHWLAIRLEVSEVEIIVGE